MKTQVEHGGHSRIDYLEALRFILAFMTMAWHYYYFAPRLGAIDASAADFPGLRYCSFGVDIFFIISGFIITASAIGRSPGEFLTNRLVRLGPCLLVCATITFVADLAATRSPSTLSWLSSIFVLPLAFYSGIDWSYWSLGIEVTFYALVFVSMCFVDIERNVPRIALVLTTYSALTLLPGFPLKSRPEVIYPFEQYAPFFAAGMLLYQLIMKKRVTRCALFALISTFALVIVRSWMEAARISKALTGLVPTPMTGVMIALAALGIFILFTRKVANPHIQRCYAVLGKTSYPLYLIHQNLGYMAVNFAAKRLHIGFDTRPLVMLIMVVVAMLVAVVCEPFLAPRYRKYLGRLGAMLRLTPPSKATVRDVE